MPQGSRPTTLNPHGDGRSLESSVESITMIILDACLARSDDENPRLVLRIKERAGEEMEVMHHVSHDEAPTPEVEAGMGVGVETDPWDGYESDSQGTIRLL